MNERDRSGDQLDFDLVPVTWSAMQVIDGSHVLTPNEKRLLFKVYGFSRHDGCFASTNILADRLGMSARTVEDTRTRLRKLGLLVAKRRRHKTAAWMIVITRDAIPPDAQKIDADTFMRYRERVDNWLEFQERRHLERNVKPVIPRVQKPVIPRVCIRGGGETEDGNSPPFPSEGEVFHKLGETMNTYLEQRGLA